MHDIQTSRPRFWRRHPWWTGIAAAVLALAAMFGGYHLVLYLQVAELEAQARAAGFPITAEELEAWYPEPEGENAAPLVLEAGRLVEELRGGPDNDWGDGVPWLDEARWPPADEPLPTELVERIEHFLAANQRAIDLYRRAGMIGQARYPTNYQVKISWLNTVGPFHVESLRTGARLLAVEAVYAADQGEVERAIEALRALSGLARTLDGEPDGDAFVSRVNILAVGLAALEEVAARCDLATSVWVDMAAWAEHLTSSDYLVRAWAGDRIIWTDPIELRSTKKVRCLLGLYQEDRAFWLSHTSIAIAKVQSMPMDELRHEVDFLNDLVPDNPEELPLSGSLLSTLAMELKLHIMGCALAQLLQAGAALEVYRADHLREESGYPDSLAALVPRYPEAVPVDPLDSQPIRYQRLRDGFLLYSVGQDGVDNGGTKLDKNGYPSGPGTDIVFTVRPPSLRAARGQ